MDSTRIRVNTFGLIAFCSLQITDLTPLATNLAYKSILDLYMDDNLVESIARLEGSDWLDRFRLFNLRGNKLTDVSDQMSTGQVSLSR